MVWTYPRPPSAPTPTATPLDANGHTLALEEATRLRDRALAAAAGLRDHAFAAAARLQDRAFASSRPANENDSENEPAGRQRLPVNIAAARARRGAGLERALLQI